MKKRIPLILILLILAVSCAHGEQKAEDSRIISPDRTMETLDDEDGTDAFGNTLDHPGSRYYVINDYFNMESGGSLHILPRFATYQQTTEYSCGCTAALMVLYYFGIHDYNEMDICRIAGTNETTGTSVEGLQAFLEGAGLRTEYHADTKKRFNLPEECEDYLIRTLDQGAPVLVSWMDWGGHWQIIIGMDTCDTSSPYDDVLIMADPYDITDHCQDGYYTVPFGRFFDMWQEGPLTGKKAPYIQPFIAVYPTE